MAEIQVTTIRELIDALMEKADDLIDGLDTRIATGLCDGVNLQMTYTVGVDFWTRVSRSDGRATSQFMLVQGHPHREDGGPLPVMSSLVADADEQLRRWSAGED
jgi:hypothetical protein